MTTTTISRSRQQRTAPQAVPAGERVFGMPLEHGPLAPSTARHAARPVLASWGLTQDQIYDTLLVISELVTNAVTHALPPVVLHLHATADGSGHVQVHVSDGGPQAAAAATSWAATRPDDEHGRGDTIITALAHHTGTGSDPGIDGLINHWADLSAA
ncbi:ATP-binding protein [Streptomyces sp. NBC_01077]|uniref:ATP-binding protein n=1 Tax=Streptomyces sp. NBC_01077 TaxID=2903746 RepID=UPI00386A60EE|nr:ATP-binding protein [Streptomyces sp. NBC_01077]WSV43529.1 ATP-binding protein [Streptomyces sp. NBC_01077]